MYKLKSSQETLGERLKKERLRLGYSQEDLAKQGGISRTTQIKFERDEAYPNTHYLHRLEQIDVDIHFIISGIRNLMSTEYLRLMPEVIRILFEECLNSVGETLSKNEMTKLFNALYVSYIFNDYRQPSEVDINGVRKALRHISAS